MSPLGELVELLFVNLLDTMLMKLKSITFQILIFSLSPLYFIPLFHLLMSAFCLPLYIAENGQDVGAHNSIKGCDSGWEPPGFFYQRQQHLRKPLRWWRKREGASGWWYVSLLLCGSPIFLVTKLYKATYFKFAYCYATIMLVVGWPFTSWEWLKIRRLYNLHNCTFGP